MFNIPGKPSSSISGSVSNKLLETKKPAAPISMRQFLDQSQGANVSWLGGNKLDAVPTQRKPNPVNQIIDSAKGGVVKFLGGVKNKAIEDYHSTIDFGKGLGKGAVTLAANIASQPFGYQGDIGSLGGTQSLINPQEQNQLPSQLYSALKPGEDASSSERAGFATGSLSPGAEAIQPWLENKGVNPGLAFGAGLLVDVFSPGPGELSPGALNAAEELSTTLLGRLKGKSVVSKQFIEDLARAQDIRAPEKEIISRVLNDMASDDATKYLDPMKRSRLQVLLDDANTRELSGKEAKQIETLTGEAVSAKQASIDKIDINDFKKRVQLELVPLTTKELGGNVSPGRTGFLEHTGDDGNPPPLFEGITLSDTKRGPISRYVERIYESPIENSAGDIHWNRSPYDMIGDESYSADAKEFNKYFAHTRFEDLPEDVRRFLELQSDLFQKGNLDKSVHNMPVDSNGFGPGKYPHAAESNARRRATLDKLRPYENTWYERIIREEAKKAAEDGKTKLQFPTGATALEVEGIGDTTTRWFIGNTPESNIFEHDVSVLTRDNMKVGRYVNYGDMPLVITEVLGDGRFKTVSSEIWDGFQRSAKEEGKTLEEFLSVNEDARNSFDAFNETRDISGKLTGQSLKEAFNDAKAKFGIDSKEAKQANRLLTIYKFYEDDVAKFLKNKFGATRVTDPQGIEWWELNLNPEMAKNPVLAYGKAPISSLAFLGLGAGAVAAGTFAGRKAAEGTQIDVNNTGLEPAMRIDFGAGFKWIPPEELLAEADVQQKEFEPDDESKEAIDAAISSAVSKVGVDQDVFNTLVLRESSYGQNDDNRDLDEGTYGWLTGFTKGTADSIRERQAAGDKRYDGLELDFSTPEQALISTAQWWKWLSDHYGIEDPVELYSERYNAHPDPEARKLRRDAFERELQARISI